MTKHTDKRAAALLGMMAVVLFFGGGRLALRACCCGLSYISATESGHAAGMCCEDMPSNGEMTWVHACNVVETTISDYLEGETSDLPVALGLVLWLGVSGVCIGWWESTRQKDASKKVFRGPPWACGRAVLAKDCVLRI